MKRTIAVKRAELYKLYLIALHGNYKMMYYSTLSDGIPGGMTCEQVKGEIQRGDYDDDIDEMIELYDKVISRWAGYGFYVDFRLVYSRDKLLDILKEIGLTIPDKIYKRCN